jgi:hypothetical protein
VEWVVHDSPAISTLVAMSLSFDLSPADIREVATKRVLSKEKEKEYVLRDLFQNLRELQGNGPPNAARGSKDHDALPFQFQLHIRLPSSAGGRNQAERKALTTKFLVGRGVRFVVFVFGILFAHQHERFGVHEAADAVLANSRPTRDSRCLNTFTAVHLPRHGL